MTDLERREQGDALVARLFAGLDEPASAMPAELRRHTVEHLYGNVWCGDGLDLVQRSMITCTTLVALGQDKALAHHFRAARNLGIPRVELEAMITHVAHYAGWPAAFGAVEVLGEVWDQMDGEATAAAITGS